MDYPLRNSGLYAASAANTAAVTPSMLRVHGRSAPLKNGIVSTAAIGLQAGAAPGAASIVDDEPPIDHGH